MLLEWMEELRDCITDLVKIGYHKLVMEIINIQYMAFSVGQNQELEIIQRLLKMYTESCESLGLQQLSEEATCLESRFWIQSDSVWTLLMYDFG